MLWLGQSANFKETKNTCNHLTTKVKKQKTNKQTNAFFHSHRNTIVEPITTWYISLICTALNLISLILLSESDFIYFCIYSFIYPPIPLIFFYPTLHCPFATLSAHFKLQATKLICIICIILHVILLVLFNILKNKIKKLIVHVCHHEYATTD